MCASGIFELVLSLSKDPASAKWDCSSISKNISVYIANTMNETSISYIIGLLEDLKDPRETATYLNAALEDGSQELFMLALRDVADARVISDLAKKSELNRENMYQILSEIL